MGTIVINQTDCKQNVVLTSSLDGISGGYYDAAGVWHELGGSEFVYEFADIEIGSLADGFNNNYFDASATTRCGERYFLLLTPGEYDLDLESSDTIEYAVNYYTKAGLNKVLAHTNLIQNTDGFSLGWTSTNIKKFTLPDTAFAMRLSFRHPDNSAFGGVPITKCVIKKV